MEPQGYDVTMILLVGFLLVVDRWDKITAWWFKVLTKWANRRGV